MQHLLRIAMLATLLPCAGAASASADDLVPTLTCQTLSEHQYDPRRILVHHLGAHRRRGEQLVRAGSRVPQSADGFPARSGHERIRDGLQDSAETPQLTWFVDGNFVVANHLSSPDCSQARTSNTIRKRQPPACELAGNRWHFYVDAAAELLDGPKVGGVWPTARRPHRIDRSDGCDGIARSAGATGPPEMPVRNTAVTIILCDALFVPGTWTVGARRIARSRSAELRSQPVG
jgi:hypothetical protein